MGKSLHNLTIYFDLLHGQCSTMLFLGNSIFIHEQGCGHMGKENTNSNEDSSLSECLGEGRLLLKNCPLFAEAQDSNQAKRTEWNRGTVVPTVYLGATTGNQLQRMAHLLKNFR